MQSIPLTVRLTHLFWVNPTPRNIRVIYTQVQIFKQISKMLKKKILRIKYFTSFSIVCNNKYYRSIFILRNIPLFFSYETRLFISRLRLLWNSRIISPFLVKNRMIKVDRWWPFLGSQYFLSRLSCSIWRAGRKGEKARIPFPTASRLIGPPKYASCFSALAFFNSAANFNPLHLEY